jgi:dTDP-4-dehydrorhamnose reductase
MSPRCVMVPGATGSLGSAVCRWMARYCRVVAPLPRALSVGSLDPRVHWLPTAMDAAFPDDLDKLVRLSKADVVINCAAAIPGPENIRDCEASRAINAVFPHRLADAVARNGRRLIHLSTDAVFSGRDGPYSVTDRPDPIDSYGRTKLVGEVGGAGIVTVRTTFVGWMSTGRGLVNWLLDAAGEVTGYRNYLFTPLSLPHLCETLWRLSDTHSDVDGIQHLGGSPLSKFELLRQLQQRLSLDVTVTPLDEPRTDRRLESEDTWDRLGVPQPTIDQLCEGVISTVRNRQTSHRIAS